mgnify:CR=1 FL=1
MPDERDKRKLELKKIISQWEVKFVSKFGEPPSVVEKKESDIAEVYVAYSKIKDAEMRELKAKEKAQESAAKKKELGGLLARLKAAENKPDKEYEDSDDDEELLVFAESIREAKEDVAKIVEEIEKSKANVNSLNLLKKDLKAQINEWTINFTTTNNRQPNAAEKRDGSGILFKSYWGAEEDLQLGIKQSKELLVKYEEEQLAVEDLENELAAMRQEKKYRPTTPEAEEEEEDSTPATPEADPFSELDSDQWEARKVALEADVKKHQGGLSVLKGFIKTSSFQLDELKRVKNAAKNVVKSWVQNFQVTNGRDPSVEDKQEDNASRLFNEYNSAKDAFEKLLKQRDEASVLEQKTFVMLESKSSQLDELMSHPARE